MLLYNKKQSGGTIGKAGRMHVQPTDRSAPLQYTPQVREVKSVGSTSGTTSKSRATQEKMYQGMLPSDQEYLRALKEKKMQEITDKYAQDGYEGSQDNLRDLEEYRSYDADMASKGKHYAGMFSKNATTVKSRQAEGSMAAVEGNVLIQSTDGSYDVVNYEELMSKDKDGNMVAKPLTVSEAMLLRQSNPAFNSFGELGEFVDRVAMNTYKPAELPKTLKALASQAKSSKVMVDDKGNQMSIEQIVRDIASDGGVAVTLKTNKDKVQSLANFFNSSVDASTNNYLNNKAIETVYQGIANGTMKLEQGQTIGDLVNNYKSGLVTDYFYGAISEELGLKKGSGSGDSGGPQRKIDVNPMAVAFAGAGSDKVSLEVPTDNGRVSHQDYMGSRIAVGNEMFNTNAAYGLPADATEWEGKTVQNNKELLKAGGNNFNFMSLADGTVIKDSVGLDRAMVHPNASFHLTFAPVKNNPSMEGGYVTAFDQVANYQTVIDELHDKWAQGLIKNEDDIKKELIAKGMMNDDIMIKPMLTFDVILKDNEKVDNRFLKGVENDDIQDKFEDATDDWMRDKKIQRTKAFMVVDEPGVYTTINLFGNDFIHKMDQASATFFASGRYKHNAELSDIATQNQTDIFDDAAPKKKEGGKIPSADDIHKILFSK